MPKFYFRVLDKNGSPISNVCVTAPSEQLAIQKLSVTYDVGDLLPIERPVLSSSKDNSSFFEANASTLPAQAPQGRRFATWLKVGLPLMALGIIAIGGILWQTGHLSLGNTNQSKADVPGEIPTSFHGLYTVTGISKIVNTQSDMLFFRPNHKTSVQINGTSIIINLSHLEIESISTLDIANHTISFFQIKNNPNKIIGIRRLQELEGKPLGLFVINTETDTGDVYRLENNE